MQEELKRELVDEEGENLAVRSFLMQYSCDRATDIATMRSHMRRSGWDRCWPEWVEQSHGGNHLTKAGAQLWIRHLIEMERRTPVSGEAFATFEDWLASPITPPANIVEYARLAFNAGRATVSGEVAEGVEHAVVVPPFAEPAGQHGATIADAVDSLLAEAEDHYDWGGSEDGDGGLCNGGVDFDELRGKIRAVLAEVSASPVPRAQGGITSDKLPTRYETPSGSRLYANSLSPTDMSDIRQARGQQAGGAEDGTVTLYKFASVDQYDITGRGIAFGVKNPRDCQDFDHLINKQVIIDGKLWTVKGVERFAHSPPWRKGEGIGLFVGAEE